MTEVSRTVLAMLGYDFTYSMSLPSVGASGGVLVAWRHGLGPAVATQVDNFSVSVQFSPANGRAWWLTLCVWAASQEENSHGLINKIHQFWSS